jgi:hypothetical protein
MMSAGAQAGNRREKARHLHGAVRQVHYNRSALWRSRIVLYALQRLQNLLPFKIRHYAANDAAVSLRLVRAIGDIAGALQHVDTRAKLLERARRVVDGCGQRLGESEAARLKQRLTTIEQRLTS